MTRQCTNPISKRFQRRFLVFLASGAEPIETAYSLLVFVALVVLAGCHEDMYNQPRYEPLERSEFFADGRTSRRLVPGTVPYGAKPLDDVLSTGRSGGDLVTELPMELTQALL